MNKLTLSALIASTLFISACDQAQDATEGAMDKATEMTHNAAEHAEDAADHAMEASKGMANEAMEAGKDMASSAMEKMDAYTGSGLHDGRTGYPVGQEEDINTLTKEYHDEMKAH
jgi:predicted RecB family endonuclease